MKKTLLIFLIIIIAIGSACKSVEKPEDFDNDKQIDIQQNIQSLRQIKVFIPSIKEGVDYQLLCDYFNDKYALDMNIDAFTQNKRGLDSSALQYNTAITQNFMSTMDNPDKIFEGIYLYTQRQFQQAYTWAFKEYKYKTDLGEELGSLNEEFPMVGSPMNTLEVIDSLNKAYLEPYTDLAGNVWAIPYEFKYPEVKVRKFNKDILEELDREVPVSTDELYNLLVDVKYNTKIPNILPEMKIESVFSGFEDIVRAFGIKAPNEANAFFAIQYDEENDIYTDIALKENMRECINYFTALINEDIIKLSDGIESSNEAYHNGLLFSVFDTIESDEDLSIPYTTKLLSEGFEAHQYFEPSRYIYVLGRNAVLDSEINKFFSTLYLNKEAALVARYGIEDGNYDFNRNKIYISKEKYEIAPKLIGEFYDDPYSIEENNAIKELKDKITEEHIKSGYYRYLNPMNNACELSFNQYFYESDNNVDTNALVVYIKLFYNMLGEHFFNPERPTTDEFIEHYRMEAKRLMLSDERFENYFNYAIPTDTIY